MNQLANKQDKTAVVQISNFETFNPSTHAVTSQLAVGASCQFYADYNANGKPWMGSGTLGANNNPLSSIYYWSGSITRIYGTYYMLTAVGANTETGRPQMATRVYYGNNRYDWIVNTDYSQRGDSGYVKLPSGILIQWGYYTGTTQNATIYYPIAFTAYPFAGLASYRGNSSFYDTAIVVLYNLDTSMTYFNLRRRRWNGSAHSDFTDPAWWVVIGTWK